MIRMLKPALAAAAAFGSVQATAEPLVRSVDDPALEWGACPDFLPQGCAIAVLRGDPASPNADILFRLPPGALAPRHWHSSAERMVLLTGRMELDYDGHPRRAAERGDYLYGPARLPHSARCVSADPCTLFIAFEEPVDALPGAPPS